MDVACGLAFLRPGAPPRKAEKHPNVINQKTRIQRQEYTGQYEQLSFFE